MSHGALTDRIHGLGRRGIWCQEKGSSYYDILALRDIRMNEERRYSRQQKIRHGVCLEASLSLCEFSGASQSSLVLLSISDRTW